MSIKALVRRNIRSGTSEYADVEAVHLGMATVRLVGDSARMTNLPYFGDVSVGDRVIVNRSTDSPYVYGFEGIEDLPEEGEEAPDRGETYDPLAGMVCGRLTHSEEQEDGTKFSYKYGNALTLRKNITKFDTVVYDTHDLYATGLSSTVPGASLYYGFGPQESGVYFVRATVGISTDEPLDWRWWSWMALRGFREAGTTTKWWATKTYVTQCSQKTRLFNPVDEIVTFSVANLFRLEPGDYMAPLFYFRTSHNEYGSYGKTQYNYIRGHKEEGKYPYLEWALVASGSQEEKGQRYWWDVY